MENLRAIRLSYLIISLICSFAIINLSGAVSASEDYSLPGVKPLFEVAIGNRSAGELGEWVDEENIVEYEKFYFPASFNVYGDKDLVLVLDSIKNRICKYSLSGEFKGAVELPFKSHPIDFAWFQRSNRAFVVFQQSREIGVFDIDFAADEKPSSPARLNVADLLGVKNAEELYIQKIWPCDIENTHENIFVLNTISDGVSNASFSYKDRKLKVLREINPLLEKAIGKVSKPEALDIRKSFLLQTENLKSGALDHIMLLKEFVSSDGFSCKGVRPSGSDMKNNLYIEALFGTCEDGIKSAYIYKFDETGKYLGKTEILRMPEMLTNRFISVDSDGSIYYMRKEGLSKKIQFYRFVVNPIN